MLIQEIFADVDQVTRDIPPVIYFHEQEPDKVRAEVSEYIITGGYPDNDPRHKRIQSGIHEQFVKLLRSLARELQKKEGTDLPASWISGFYGSGKSSFAKLLGLALNGMVLPDGKTVAESLLSRDDSPRSQEFRDAWQQVVEQIDPIAIVFDIGAVARDDEQIHSAVKRQVQQRLGYCVSHYVAEFELKLEIDGQWQAFLDQAQQTLGKSWDEVKHQQLAEEDFSEVMHQLDSDRYLDPMSWYDSHIASRSDSGTSPEETTRAITAMLKNRAGGKTLFLVIDEVSQYIYQNDNRTLKLQSFVADLGQKLKGKVWLLATGQQKLEESDDESNIGKLKDRFPPKLRVHLDPANIRDVVHKRLLKKAPQKEANLRSLFEQYRSDLKLYAYSCETITEEDFLEVYPLLPGYIDLLMQITSNLRLRSSRSKGDDYAIRGLLQLLGELFRTQKLGERELGALVSLDLIFSVQQSALEADVQNTLSRIFNHAEIREDDLCRRVTKAIALLELIQEQQPTTSKLIAQCLYDRLGQGNQENLIQQALDKLRNAGLISYSEKSGYKIQSSTGQEWQRERDHYGVTDKEISEIVKATLKDLVGGTVYASYKGKNFRWSAYYSDSRYFQDDRLLKLSELDVINLDFRYLAKEEERKVALWVQSSDRDQLRDRLIWVVGSPKFIEDDVRELARSRHIVDVYQPRSQSISREKQRLLFEEQTRCEELEKQVKNAVAQVFLAGEIYFRGRQIHQREQGNSFATILFRVAERILPELYDQYINLSVLPNELNQLLEPNISGASVKFMQDGLGILDLDVGKYVPTCSGLVPTRIFQYITENNGVAMNPLLNDFGGPPYGYSPDVIKACLLGLLRAGKIRLRPESGAEITSVRDPGTKDVFTKERDFKRAEILPERGEGITARKRNQICQFFQEYLDVDLNRENDAIADAVFNHFPSRNKALQELEKQYSRLPQRPELPPVLLKLRQALENCLRSRQVESTVIAVDKHLDQLRDGLQQLGILTAELTDSVVETVKKAGDIVEHQVVQLREINQVAEVEQAIAALEAHLQSERPWREINSLDPQIQEIINHYQMVRSELLNRQEKQAEAALDKIKRRQGYNRLNDASIDYVVQPLQKARYETTKEALYPALLKLRDTALLNLEKANEEANRNFDNCLSKEIVDPIQVIQLKLLDELRNREVSSPEEIQTLLSEIGDRLTTQLKENVRIRII
jgi:hypothetical protein